MKLTMVISKGEKYFIGTIREIPGVITQGKTIEETKENVIDSLQLYLEAMEQAGCDTTCMNDFIARIKNHVPLILLLFQILFLAKH